MNFTDINIDQFLGMEDSNPIMWLIWIVPIVIFIFYGQRIQLHVTSGEINKNIEKLLKFRDESKKEMLDHLKKSLHVSGDVEKSVERFIEYFTIMPVDIDPNGIMPKIKHLMRSREDYTRLQVKMLCGTDNSHELSKVQNLLEVV
ncbi:MAG: DUF1512 family protein, partial [Candidatus Nitrosotenuis sp.]